VRLGRRECEDAPPERGEELLQGTEGTDHRMARRGPGDARADLPARTAGRRAAPPSILVVDDDPDIRDLVERVLRRAGAEVVAVADGRSALRMIADGLAQPSILLTDIDMPGMNGIELSARVRAMRPGIDIVLMTGDPSSAEAARERPDLVRQALLKPMTSADLLAAMGLAPTNPEPEQERERQADASPGRSQAPDDR